MTFTLTAALSVGLIGCDKSSGDGHTNAPNEDNSGEVTEPQSENEGVANLCTDYDSCDECIAGQVDKGKSEGQAQTQCGLAATGCWTTWEKPVVCGGKTVEEAEEADEES